MFCNVSYFILFLQFYMGDVKRVNLRSGPLRVMGGRNATTGEFPYVMRMGMLTDKSRIFAFMCTCSLLKPTWSLTAAHCIDGMRGSEKPSVKKNETWVIQYDISTFNGTDTRIILSSIMYSSFNIYTSKKRIYDTRITNDIGLLLSEEVPVFKYAKISAVDYSSLLGHRVLALGYGRTTGPEGIYDIADKLNKSLQVLDVIVSDCGSFDVGRTVVKPSFCIMGPCGKWSNVCHGDSGGPVLHSSGVIGVNTATEPKNCAKQSDERPNYKFIDFAGVITPVSPYVDWISKIIKD